MKVAILLGIAVIMVNHKGGNVGAARLASVDRFNVLDGEAANAVGFDLAVALVEVNNVFVVQSFNDRAFLGAQEGNQVVFSDEVVHSVFLVTGKDKRGGAGCQIKLRAISNSSQHRKRQCDLCNPCRCGLPEPQGIFW